MRELALAGLHVFRYFSPPGTPATRMSGAVDERTKKARAAELLAVGPRRARGLGAAGPRRAGPRPRGAAARRWTVGRPRGRLRPGWRSPAPGDPDDLENAIVTVRRTAIDGEVADRVTGEILVIDPRTTLTALAAAGARRLAGFDRRRPCRLTACSAGSSPAEVPAQKLHQDDLVVATRDIGPKAPPTSAHARRPHRVGRRPHRRRRAAPRPPVRGRRGPRARRGPGRWHGGWCPTWGRTRAQSVPHLHVHLLGRACDGLAPG